MVDCIDIKFCIAKATSIYPLAIVVLGWIRFALLNCWGHWHWIAVSTLDINALSICFGSSCCIFHKLCEVLLITIQWLWDNIVLAFHDREIRQLLIKNFCQSHRRHKLATHLLLPRHLPPKAIILLPFLPLDHFKIKLLVKCLHIHILLMIPQHNFLLLNFWALLLVCEVYAKIFRPSLVMATWFLRVVWFNVFVLIEKSVALSDVGRWYGDSGGLARVV